jgi:hypothetical protein
VGSHVQCVIALSARVLMGVVGCVGLAAGFFLRYFPRFSLVRLWSNTSSV